MLRLIRGGCIHIAYSYNIINDQVKAVHVHHELMSVDNGLLTPTFKAKRVDVTKKFASQIKELYNITSKL